MVDWGRALEVFVVGLVGVFACLAILDLAINVYSKIIVMIENRRKIMKDEKERL